MPARSPAPNLDELERLVCQSGCFAMQGVARAVARLYDQVFAPMGFNTMQVGILRVCGVRGRMHVEGLACELAANRSVIERGIRPLVSAGKLRRVAEEGTRKRLIELTPEGHKTLTEAIICWNRVQHDLLQQLGETRWNRIKAALTALTDLASPASDPMSC